MLPFSPEPSVFQTAKCFFSHGVMGHIDRDQPPVIESIWPSQSLSTSQPSSSTVPNTVKKLKKPWSSIQALGLVNQLELVVPQSCAKLVQRTLAMHASNSTTAQPRYAHVVMTLGQVLEGAFFTEYIKAGNVLMLSEGRLGQDNVFSLKDGHLTLYLEREAYERAGLVGKPHGAKGNRGLRSRWIVKIDLNPKAMWPGKSGFDRLIYACKNVFNTPRTWLFYNMFDGMLRDRGFILTVCIYTNKTAPTPDPLDAFSPKWVTIEPVVTRHAEIALPPLGRPASLLVGGGQGSDRLETEEAVTELYEWLSLVRLGSPRIQAADNIDPYLSRYQVPVSSDDDATAPSDDICTIRWRGFFSPTWACETLLGVLIAMQSSSSSSSPSRPWLAMSVSGFSSSIGPAGDSAECTFFRPADAPREFLLWDVHSHE
jgi:ribonucleases P/MRP protein subunit RPP40